MQVISSEKLPIKLWAETNTIEQGAIEQMKNLANLPFAFKHVAIMPDCHSGYGMPIGGVLATKGVIIPNAVGVDIGCGMLSWCSGVKEIHKDTLQSIVNNIKKVVPVGFEWHQERQEECYMPENKYYKSYPIVRRHFENAFYQIGTLGGGNHFIEIQMGSDENIWVMIHSGSRNLGKQVADHYNKLAVELNEKWHSSVPKEWELAFLPINTEEAKMYRKEMEYCVQFALANRSLMLERIQEVFSEHTSVPGGKIINIAHNYAAMENHFGENVMVHRKGATKVSSNITGIIPGSQGTKSYIVKGKNNPQSFNSCSHGAGRVMGRKQAIRSLNLQEQKELMDNKGIIHSMTSEENLDEAPGAYKDIDMVMKNQEDLVEILVELKPLAVIKG